VRSGAVLVIGICTALTAPQAAGAGRAFELTQRLGLNEVVRLTVSTSGVRVREVRRGRTVGGAIVRYSDGRLFVLDYPHKRYTSETIAAAAKRVAKERELMRRVRTEVTFRTKSGWPEFPIPVLKRTDTRALVANRAARAYLVRQNGVLQRIWLAVNLPGPPRKIQARVRKAVAVQAEAGPVVLRAEVRNRGVWRRALDTTASREVELPNDAFRPPSGWKLRKPSPPRKPSTVPALVQRLRGPISPNPDVFALYWGGPFPASFTGAMNGFLASIGGAGPGSYWAPLAQYGVARGAFIGSSVFGFPLPASVGIWDFIAVEGMVTNAYLLTPAPKIWWRIAARDPLIAIFVRSDAVATSGWTGYHLLAPSPVWLLPWPISLAAHPAMPWFLVKAGLSGGAPSVGVSTGTTTHELVETVTDPVPLSANFDPNKFPAWVGGEIADICLIGTTPAQMFAMRFGLTVARYWSNAAGACVG
jgi:hypothetical protein